MLRPSSETLGHYETMARIRATELAVASMWASGLISGEMHSGVGEEGIVAGISSHLGPGDAVACDHRSTGVFVARGVDVSLLFLEMLGHDGGLNRGRAGHMHLMDEERLLLADGIVGSAGPGACGFALAAEQLRPGSVAVAYFGEGALNQGMLMESFNLAQVWRLPVLFVCKDNGWSITTRSSAVSAGSPTSRVEGFGIRTARVRGSDVSAVSRVAGRLIAYVRKKRQPAFLHARCLRPEGHFLGDPMLRLLDDPVGQAREVAGPILAAARRPGAEPARVRLGAVLGLTGRLTTAVVGSTRHRRWDPVARARRRLDREQATTIDQRVLREVTAASDHALRQAAGSG